MILTELNNVVVWTVSTHPLVSKSSSHSTKTLGSIPSVLIATGIPVTFMFHSCFSSLARSWYLFLSISFSFTLWSAGSQSPLFSKFFFFFCWLPRHLFTLPRLGDLFVSQNSKAFCASHFLGQILACAYIICSYFLCWDLNFLWNSQWITFLKSRIKSFSLTVLNYYICFFCDWSFRLYGHIIYIWYFIAYCWVSPTFSTQWTSPSAIYSSNYQ